MPPHWRTVRVFLSSTFRDVHAERDHLVKVTFPRCARGCCRIGSSCTTSTCAGASPRRSRATTGSSGVSVTELEIRHGALLQPEGRYCLTILRQEEAVASTPQATRQRDFVDSDPRLQGCLGNQALILQAAGDSEGAKRLLKSRKSSDEF
jgi:hypothetical protein